MNDVMIELLVRLDRARHENATAFAIVWLDETGAVVDTTGPFDQAELALVQAAKDTAVWERRAEPGEGEYTYVVVPLWGPSC